MQGMNGTNAMAAKALLAAAMIIFGVAPASAAEESKKLAPLKLELPKPMFIGTPKNISSPNLEKSSGKTRPAFMVPQGTANLALKKPVTSSDKEPIVGELSQVTDGDKNGVDGSFVELGPKLQWVQIDLGRKAEIFAILVWHYHTEARVYRDVIVQLADDPDFISGVKTVYNNDHDNSAGLGVGQDKEYIETYEGRLIGAKGAKGRHVRLYSNGNTSNEQNHYVEVEVYGRPAK
jgi:hypothetical protein